MTSFDINDVIYVKNVITVGDVLISFRGINVSEVLSICAGTHSIDDVLLVLRYLLLSEGVLD